jgi:hypothetical protein
MWMFEMSIASSKPVDPLNKPVPSPEDEGAASPRSVRIQAGRQGQVAMETEREPLAAYLGEHQEWIDRCFKPLKVFPLSESTYKLQFFRIGGLGFELEPCFGVEIWAEEDYLFRLGSIDLPSDADLPYTVDCQSYFQLRDLPDSGMTQVNWDLELDIWMELPCFLSAFPHSLVYNVGAKVVRQVTRRMSDRLTHNVCTDYYRSVGKRGKKYQVVQVAWKPSTGGGETPSEAPEETEM